MAYSSLDVCCLQTAFKCYAGFFLRDLMQKVGGIWSHIIFGWILFEGADAESWRDLEPHNFRQDSFYAESWRDLEP
jgi:hypothetical protein